MLKSIAQIRVTSFLCIVVSSIMLCFPFPSVAQRAAALAILSAVQDGCPIVLDGLAFGALAEASALRYRTPLIALVHQPLALDSGLEAAHADVFRESERAALAAAARVVVTSQATARIVRL